MLVSTMHCILNVLAWGNMELCWIIRKETLQGGLQLNIGDDHILVVYIPSKEDAIEHKTMTIISSNHPRCWTKWFKKILGIVLGL